MPASLVCLAMCKMSNVHCSPGEYRDVGGHEGNLGMSWKSDLGPRKQQVTWDVPILIKRGQYPTMLSDTEFTQPPHPLQANFRDKKGKGTPGCRGRKG